MSNMRVLLLLTLVGAAFASDVLDFDDSNFSTQISQHSVILVEFFAPWCGHCKKLAPEYERAATSLKSFSVALAKVDCTENTGVCGKYGVSGYPTLKIFRDGEFAEDYNGPRDASGIVKTMKSKAGPSSKALASVNEAETLLNGFDSVVVGFFTDDSSDMAKELQKAASSLSEKFRFAHSTDADVAEKYGYSDEVVLFRAKRLANKFEDSEVKYEGSPAGVKAWINENMIGLCGHRTPDNADQFKNPLVVAYYDVDYVKNIKGTNYWRNRVMKVAKKLDSGVNFAVSDSNEFAHEVAEYGISGGEDVKVAAKDSSGQKFVMDGAFSMPALEKFVTDLVAGNLEPYMKSEAVPTPNDGPVKVVVARNFDEIVNNPDKDVLIEFYAPWCGHCKTLEPKFKELGEKLSAESGVVIAKMDATANDVPPQFKVSGFPTIYFAPKGNKKNPKKYESGREVDDFIKYLAQEATGGLEGFDTRGKKTEL